MINTKCQWCKREMMVAHWEPLTNEALKTTPVICRPCRVEYEAGWFRRLVRMSIEETNKGENKVIK